VAQPHRSIGGATEISRRTDYAVRILVELARQPEGGRVSARELGTLVGVQHPFARRIVTQMAAAGLVDTRRGARGGVGLARPANTITLNDVIVIMEGGVSLNLCVRDPAACERSPSCPVHTVWNNAGRMVIQYLDDCTIGDLAALAAAEAGMSDQAVGH
jgi:Rrf2 family transcriptional regulator, nitric oxide-sensitive transcriptional repressor